VTNSRVCECGKATIQFKTEDAGKTLICPVCEREYTIFLEMEDDHGLNYELTAEPNEALLLG